MRDDKPNVIIELTFKFSLSIIDYCEKLEAQRKYVLARQLLKSGTSIGANSREAQNAESPDIGNLLTDLLVIIKVISKIIGSSKK